jgi:hypothetical protein
MRLAGKDKKGGERCGPGYKVCRSSSSRSKVLYMCVLTRAALREAYIFPPHSPPFPLLSDLISSLHPQVQMAISRHPLMLERAVTMSNLATFVWTILLPDEAGDLLPDESRQYDSDEARRARPVRTTVKERVTQRNRMLILAWKNFWFVVVPREKRSSESALKLWLDFATQVRFLPDLSDPQIRLLSTCPDILASSPLNPFIPPPPPSQLKDLFSPSAVSRHGQWEADDESEAESVTGLFSEKGKVERKWGSLARRRETEVSLHSS